MIVDGWDYSRCGGIVMSASYVQDGEYVVFRYDSKPNPYSMTHRWWRMSSDIAPGKMLERLGLRIGPAYVGDQMRLL